MSEHRDRAGRRLAGTKRRGSRKSVYSNHLALIPFLLVSLCFILSGMEELLPAAGIYGILWTLTAVLVLVCAVYSLAVRANGTASPEERTRNAPAGEGTAAGTSSTLTSASGTSSTIASSPGTSSRQEELSGAELLRRAEDLLGPVPLTLLDSSALELAGLEAECIGGFPLDTLALESAGLDTDSEPDTGSEPDTNSGAERSIVTVGGVSLDATALELAGLEQPEEPSRSPRKTLRSTGETPRSAGETLWSAGGRSEQADPSPQPGLLTRAASAFRIAGRTLPEQTEA